MNNNQALILKQPGFFNLLAEIMQATWYRESATGADAPLQRVVNMAVLQRLMMLAANGEAQAQVRALAFDQLTELENWLVSAQDSAAVDWRAHYRFAAEQIRRFRANPEAMSPLMPVTVPPGSPI